MASLQCPRCGVGLKSVSGGNLCPKCDGCWFSQAELNDALNATDAQLRKKGLGPTLDDDKKAETEFSIRCPICSLRLKRQEYIRGSGLMVDSCFEHGMWLDDGELGELRSYLANNGK